jgi:hypothetical protein
MIYLNLLILSLIVVFIIDISGFFKTIAKHFYRWVFNNKKEMPEDFDWDNVFIGFHILKCSLCATFWTGIIYLLATSAFTILNLGYVALLAFLTPVLKDALLLIKDMLTTVLNIAFKYLTK